MRAFTHASAIENLIYPKSVHIGMCAVRPNIFLHRHSLLLCAVCSILPTLMNKLVQRVNLNIISSSSLSSISVVYLFIFHLFILLPAIVYIYDKVCQFCDKGCILADKVGAEDYDIVTCSRNNGCV